MAQSDRPPPEPVSTGDHGSSSNSSLWRRLFGREGATSGTTDSVNTEQSPQSASSDDPRSGLIRRVSRKVVPGLPRAQTFKRQQSEVRNKLEPVQPTPAERRAVSVDRRVHSPQNGSQTHFSPRSSAPNINNQSFPPVLDTPPLPGVPHDPLNKETADVAVGDLGLYLDDRPYHDNFCEDDTHNHLTDAVSNADCHSMTTSQYDALIHDELERTWILNLSMHFRDRSKREKFFVTYRERPTLWRRVTISVDYRNAPENSLELELAHIRYQRDKIAKIYDAIRESLVDIQFYHTVTNLKLETTDGRLHVHVVEDVNEIIHYPSIRTIQHMRCNRVKERDIEFDSHISGFVYKVRVNDEVLIKKEIPGPDTVDEFLYEINALNRLRHAKHVIRFYGVIIDDNEEHVKGLLISYAEQGALVDIIYDQVRPLPWSTRERWARQIVAGLSEIHEAGFVQGDFTLSNIVIDGHDNAKIIDINRRGCPVGWEPPEATPLIESNQRISMYIGVKSDLYQLGMVLWSLAMKEDEPEAHGRPLRIGPDALDVPVWFRTVVDICLSDDPRGRMSALQLLSVFPDPEFESVAEGFYDHPSISVDDGVTRREYFVDTNPSTNRYPRVRTVQPASDWSSVGWGHSYVTSPNGVGDEPFFYPTRGRSPPSPLPSNPGEYDPPKCGYTTHRCGSTTTGSAGTTPSETDTDTEEKGDEEKRVTPQRIQQSVADARHQEPEPTASLPGEADDKAIPKMAGMEANQPGVDEGVEAALTEEPRTPPQAAVIPVISGASLEHDGYLQKCDAGPTELWIESAVVQDTRDKVKTTETGLTEPVEPQNASKPSPTPDGGPPTSELAMLMNETDAGGRGDDVQALTGIEGKPDLATALPTGLNPAIAMDGTQTDTEEKLDKGDQVTTENVVADQSNPASESTALMSGSCDLPDELKGVGSTYETGPENWHQSMTNHDIAELIDAEMAADTTHDASNDTTATRHTDE